jgi:hypothetical protein
MAAFQRQWQADLAARIQQPHLSERGPWISKDINWISKDMIFGYLIGYQSDTFRIPSMDILWIQMDIMRI